MSALSRLQRLAIISRSEELVDSRLPLGAWLHSIRWLLLPWQVVQGCVEALRGTPHLVRTCLPGCLPPWLHRAHADYAFLITTGRSFPYTQEYLYCLETPRCHVAAGTGSFWDWAASHPPLLRIEFAKRTKRANETEEEEEGEADEEEEALHAAVYALKERRPALQRCRALLHFSEGNQYPKTFLAAPADAIY